MGFRSGDHRFVFLESDNPSEPRNVRKVATALAEYLRISTSLGPNTSLVIIGAPSEKERTIEEYNHTFWDMLRGLRICDPKAWPKDIPQDTEDAKWTFCFSGQPIFPVMLTPAHQERWSRHMSVPLIALQPKWVLDNLLQTPEKRKSAQSKVRGLLQKYDTIGISPDLTDYGTTGTSEIRQLCLQDKNESVQSSFSCDKYRIRPATYSDVPAVTRLYASSFGNEPLIDFFFPSRKQKPESFYTWAYRRNLYRYWTLGYSLKVVVDAHNHPVGFSWWKRPTVSYSFLEKITTLLYGYEIKNMATFERSLSTVESQVLDTPERQEGQYLALLAIDPVLQGQGLGQMLLEHDLQSVDKQGSVAWLVSLAGLENFYCKFGFRQTVKIDMEELEGWKGGMVMLRD
uniref:N-acetyltransferase domain-containing protein n=1 Tax=Gibberella zeae TaxID=5518 RepID=A0A4E9EGR2_GIBZA